MPVGTAIVRVGAPENPADSGVLRSTGNSRQNRNSWSWLPLHHDRTRRCQSWSRRNCQHRL